MKSRILLVSKYFSQEILISYTSKKNNFTVEKPGRHHQNEGIKVNISINRTN